MLEDNEHIAYVADRIAEQPHITSNETHTFGNTSLIQLLFNWLYLRKSNHDQAFPNFTGFRLYGKNCVTQTLRKTVETHLPSISS